MGCNCKWFEIIVALVLLVLAFWQGVSGWQMWAIVAAAVVLLLHALMCKNCAMCSKMGADMSTKTTRSRRRR